MIGVRCINSPTRWRGGAARVRRAKSSTVRAAEQSLPWPGAAAGVDAAAVAAASAVAALIENLN